MTYMQTSLDMSSCTGHVQEGMATGIGASGQELRGAASPRQVTISPRKSVLTLETVVKIACQQAQKKGVKPAVYEYAARETQKYLSRRLSKQLSSEDISYIFKYFWAIVKKKSLVSGSDYSVRAVLNAFVRALMAAGRSAEEIIEEMFEQYSQRYNMDILKEYEQKLRFAQFS